MIRKVEFRNPVTGETEECWANSRLGLIVRLGDQAKLEAICRRTEDDRAFMRLRFDHAAQEAAIARHAEAAGRRYSTGGGE